MAIDGFILAMTPVKLRDLVASFIPPSRSIYCLRNNLSGSLYVGSAENLRRRMVAHLSQLRRGKHHSLRMQWAWKTSGEDIIDVFVLEDVPAEANLIDREQHFVALLKPEYNFSACVDNPMRGRHHSPESIAKMKANRRGKGLGPRQFSEQHVAALKAAAHHGPRHDLRGREILPATRARMSSAAKNKFDAGFVNGATRPVELFGVRYESGKAAAAAIGKSSANVVYKIKQGLGRYLDQ